MLYVCRLAVLLMIGGWQFAVVRSQSILLTYLRAAGGIPPEMEDETGDVDRSVQD